LVCFAFNQDEDAYDVANRGLIRYCDGFGQQTFGVSVPYGLFEFLIHGTFIGVTLLTPQIAIRFLDKHDANNFYLNGGIRFHKTYVRRIYIPPNVTRTVSCGIDRLHSPMLLAHNMVSPEY
jgi:hypothetical protein